MMPNINPQKFDRAELADFYEKLVLYYENSNGLEKIALSTRAKGYRKLVGALKLEMVRFETEKMLEEATLPSADCSRNLIFFHDCKKNSLKSIFYLLRNSAAHAHIRKAKSGQIWYLIEHRYKKQLKLVCYMKKADFWCFVDESKNMKASTKSKVSAAKPKSSSRTASKQSNLKNEVA